MADNPTCPYCQKQTPGNSTDLSLSFTPIAARLTPDGKIELGHDFLLDFSCILCGCKFRLQHHWYWNEEAFEYQPDPDEDYMEVDWPQDATTEIKLNSFMGDYDMFKVGENPMIRPLSNFLLNALADALAKMPPG